MAQPTKILSALLITGCVSVGVFASPAFANDAAAGAVVSYVAEPTPALSALVPEGTDPRVTRVLWYALDAVGLPYAFGGRGNGTYDCSGLLDAAYRSAGIRVGPTTA